MRNETHSHLPPASPRFFRGFARYARWYLKRHFHALRRHGAVPEVGEGEALVVYFNHPSWWDPMVAVVLASTLFPERTHYGPIEASALERYGFFRRLGFFGVEPGVAGARRFLRVADELIRRQGTAMWITPEGQFTDPRQRPVRLRPGLGRLARRAARAGQGVALVPLALEYPFWEEKYPEALLTFGEPVRTEEVGEGLGPEGWDRLLADRLEEAQERLAGAAAEQDREAFMEMLGGSAGVGGVYDLWARAKAWARGERFEAEHGAVVRRGEKR